jgi:hypothetical protein
VLVEAKDEGGDTTKVCMQIHKIALHFMLVSKKKHWVHFNFGPRVFYANFKGVVSPPGRESLRNLFYHLLTCMACFCRG